MAWTYSGNPATSARDEVRFLIQDTTTEAQLLQDAEIDYLLSKHSPINAAISACRTLARKFARQPGSRSIGDVSISYGDLSKRYSDLAAELAAEKSSMGLSVPSPSLSGGVTESERLEFNEDVEQWQNHQITGGLSSGPDLTGR